MIDLESRINKLEQHTLNPTGTIITRVLTNTQILWSLGIGQMGMRKTYFTEPTIEECVLKAEKHYSKIKS